VLSCLFVTLSHSLEARIHCLSYRALPNAKNIVVICCDFPGVHLAIRCASILPTGYKVTLIEGNSHFNYVFNLRRYSFMKGSKEKALIPYKGVEGVGSKAILELVRGEVTGRR
jgi:NADH dehydrogenase FAD-containing subunit